MNPRKLAAVLLALVLLLSLTACIPTCKNKMMDKNKMPMESAMTENKDGMMDGKCMCGDDSKCMKDGMCMDDCQCMKDDMCTDNCMCMDGGCMKDGMCMEGCKCSKDDMNGKDMNKG